MHRSILRAVSSCCAVVACAVPVEVAVRAQDGGLYRIESKSDHAGPLALRFTAPQLALLEKLNRADVEHLERLPEVVVPESWSENELAYSVLPMRYASSERWAQFVVVYLPGQLFGAYEFGELVRWGPLSSGAQSGPTGAGRFALNWRSTGRASTIDPDWFMRWYFNYGNREGLAFHAYALPGYPASHGCIRLLERDAQWLFDWGDSWVLDVSRTRVLKAGTPVFIVGEYDFEAAPPWRSLSWLSQQVALPSAPVAEIETAAMSP